MLEPENEDGNVEYKLKLLDINSDRKENLITQMRRRCIEGNGECIYILGVEDDGTMTGITQKEYEETLDNIKTIAITNDYSITLLSKKETNDNKFVYEVLIREKNENKYIDIKVAVAGNCDAGKSTLIGTLISGEKDNGRGLARSHVFVYPHELQTGRTSAISHQIIGYDYEGKIVNYQGLGKLSWQEIVQKSSKIISILDLAGHEKYLKTTILGLAASFPDICMIIVDANNGIKPMTKEHILLCVTLKIPFIIVVTKIDICKDRLNVLQETKQSINKFLKYPGIRRLPFHIKSEDDILTCIKNIYTESITPIFYVSNTTGEGIDYLKYFFNIVNKKNPEKLDDDFVEFHIDHVFSVYGFGTVLGGHLISGTIKVGDKLLIGPNNGEYENVIIRSIHCKKIPLQTVPSGSYVCLGIKKIDKNNIKRGNVIISPNASKLCVKTFTAKITVLKAQSTTIRVGYEPILHCYAIRQVIKILNINNKKNSRNITIDDDCLRNGDSANVIFKFKYNPQYLKIGSRFILCEGKTKVMGEVTNIL
jgi:GTPase